MLHEYEIVTIIRPDLDDPTIESALSRVEGVVADAGGHALEREDWGKKKLAYPIQNHVKGHYAILRALADPGLIDELERRMRLDESVLRFLTVKVAEAVEVDVRLQQAEERKRLAAEEKARREAEEAQRQADLAVRQAAAAEAKLKAEAAAAERANAAAEAAAAEAAQAPASDATSGEADAADTSAEEPTDSDS